MTERERLEVAKGLKKEKKLKEKNNEEIYTND